MWKSASNIQQQIRDNPPLYGFFPVECARELLRKGTAGELIVDFSLEVRLARLLPLRP
jgi:hypothetical protein